MASNSNEENLWDKLNQDNNGKTKKNEIPILNASELAEKTLNETIEYDNENERVLYSDTVVLRTSLGMCEHIFKTVFKVANYVPDLNNDEHSIFWKDNVIPNLVQCLVQHAQARSTTIQAFGAVRDLSIIIKTAGDIVKELKGAPEAIQIAQKNIPAALETLDKFIAEVSSLDNTALKTFASQTNDLLKIIGPKAADFVKQKVSIECDLKRLYDQQQDLYTKLGEKQGEVNRYNFLISATNKHLNGATQELDETKLRTDELNQLNAEIENKIQNTTTSEETTFYNVFWLGLSTKTKKNVTNPNREEDKKYYESIILSRMQRVRENQNDEAAKQKVMNDLNECLSEYKSKYDKAMKELENLKNSFDRQMDDIQNQIKNKRDMLRKIDKQEIDVHKTIGLNGDTLIECLVSIRMFAETIGGGASAYAPLVSILKGIKAMVQNDVELLSSSTPLHVFLAGNRLLKQVRFLSNYSVETRPILQELQASAQLNSSINAIEWKAK